jgi:hypothetical protein
MDPAAYQKLLSILFQITHGEKARQKQA